jgi:hypothetical protein
MAKFEGALVDCIKNFAQKIKGDFAYYRICEVLCVNPATPHEWFDKGVMPKGVNLLKLVLLLELNDYAVLEFQNIEPSVRSFGQLIALGSLTAKEAAEEINLARPQNLLRLVLGRSRTNRSRMQQIKKLVNGLGQTLRLKTAEWRSKVVFKDDIKPEGPKVAAEPALAPTTKKAATHGLTHQEALATLAHQIGAMLPLARWVESEEFDDEERELLRKLSANGHSNNVFQLSTILNRLCSVTARKEFR